MSTEVFVSYSNQDYERVMPLVERLRDAGVAVWVDEGSIDAATLWSESIVEAIAECHVLIMMVSSHSTDSHNVVKEVMIASEGKKTILPIYLEPAEIPAKLKYQLTGIQHLEWFDAGNDEVFETLKDGLAKRGVTVDGKSSTIEAITQVPKKTTRKSHRPPSRSGQSSSPTRNIAFATVSIVCAILCILLIQSPEKNISTFHKKPIHLPINIPEGEKFYFDLSNQFKRSIAVSPDGQYFAYITGKKPDGNHILWLHSIKDGKRTSIRSSNLLEGLAHPFFSPDGQWLVFYNDGKMHRVATATKQHNLICDASLVSGGVWGDDNVIYFSPNEGSELQSIKISNSNEPETINIMPLDSGEQPYPSWPEYLPDNKGIIFYHESNNINADYGTIYHLDVNTGKTRVLVQNGFSPRYSNTGHLLYIRDNALIARTFNISNLSVGDEEVTLISGIRMNSFWGNAQYSISNEGTLAYISGTNIAKGIFAWVHRDGTIQQLEMLNSKVYCRYALNSTGSKVAAPVSGDIFVFDLKTGSTTPITRKDVNLHPIWSPDDSKIIYTKKIAGKNQVVLTNSNGTGRKEVLYETTSELLTEYWSDDGTMIAIAEFPKRTGYLDLKESPPKFNELATSDGTTIFGLTFSPDGKWISFGSSITGGYSCYIAPIDKPDQAQLISNIYKGEEPRWSPNGNELFYRGAQGLYSVPLEFDPSNNVKIGNPTLVVNTPWIDNPGIGYDVHPSGDKFLMVVHEEEEVTDHFNIVLNFDALIEEKFSELKNNSQL
jgi:Tol biopolymer transport system component